MALPTEQLRNPARFRLKNASCTANFKTVDQLPYCKQNKNSGSKIDCLYLDATTIQEMSEKSMLIATYVEEMDQVKNPCSDAPMSGKCGGKCSRVWENNNTTASVHYVADVEDFSLMIDNAFTAVFPTGSSLHDTARRMIGHLESNNATQCRSDPHPRSPLDYRQPWDSSAGPPCLLTPIPVQSGSQLFSFSVGELLATQNIDLDAPQPELGNKSRRFYGFVGLLEIEYSNYRPWVGVAADGGNVTYIMRLKPLEGSNFKRVKTEYQTSGTERRTITKYGMRLSAVQVGTLGAFDMTTLLLQLATATSLFAIAGLIVEMLALYVMKERKIYKASK